MLIHQSIYFSGHGEHKSKAFIFLSQVKQKVYCKLNLDSSQHLLCINNYWIISDITKTESHNCFIIHCFNENNDKRIIVPNTVYF